LIRSCSFWIASDNPDIELPALERADLDAHVPDRVLFDGAHRFGDHHFFVVEAHRPLERDFAPARTAEQRVHGHPERAPDEIVQSHVDRSECRGIARQPRFAGAYRRLDLHRIAADQQRRVIVAKVREHAGGRFTDERIDRACFAPSGDAAGAYAHHHRAPGPAAFVAVDVCARGHAPAVRRYDVEANHFYGFDPELWCGPDRRGLLGDCVILHGSSVCACSS
jgi:hypothetical protein